MSVKFEDNRVKVKARMSDEIVAFLHEAGNEIVSAAKRTGSVGKENGGQTRGAWDYIVDADNLEVTIGNPLENAIWEEFGTGEYALEGNGRKGGWYVPIGNGEGQMSQAVADAYHFKIVKGKNGKAFAYVKGKKPKRTLHKAFARLKNPLKKRLENLLGRLGQ